MKYPCFRLEQQGFSCSGMGIRAGENNRSMSNTRPLKRVTSASSERLLTLLETLPGALFVIDDDATIVYVNARAQTMLGTTHEELCGKSLWRGAPQLISAPLYQAVHTARQARQQIDVDYCSPITQTWLHAQILPTDVGIAVIFQVNTEPTRYQDALRQSDQRYRDLLESVSDRVAILSPDGLVLEISQRLLADARSRREEVIGRPFAETSWWSYASEAQQQLRAAIERASRGEIARFEARIRPQEEWYLDLAVIITPHLDADGHAEYLIYAGVDITERKQAEAEAHALIETLPQLVWITRPDGYVESCSQSWYDYTGLSAQQAQGDGWIQSTHPDDRQRVMEVWRRALRAGRTGEAEQRLRQGSTGVYRWFLTRAAPLKDARGRVLKYVGTCTDIDNRKRAEQRIKESEANWRALAETMPQIVWVTRPDGLNEYKNQRWYDYTGEPKRNTTWAHLAFIHPDDQERSQALWRHAMSTGEMYEHEERLRNGRTGEYRWFLTRGAPIRDENGRIVKWFGTLTDIEEQKRTEEALRESQERVNALMNSNIIGITVFEGEQIVDANDRFLSMTGYTREDLLAGRINWMRMTPPEDLARTLEAQRELDTHRSMTPYEKEYICQDGSRFPVVVGAVSLQHPPHHAIAFVLDNSARKELEQRKDAFISMASHELRNPLTALRLQTTLLHRQLAKQDMLVSVPALASIETQIGKIARLVEELLDVSKIQAGKLEYRQEMVDLDMLLRETVEAVQQACPSHTIILRGTTHAVRVGDRDRLEQVFTNLLNNAIKYSPDAKTVEVDLDASPEAVTISVRDHGFGIPRGQCEKIFERFYRVTDSRQKAIPGLGMGLYIVAEIVKHHGGTIAVDSTVGEGSTFTVTFPTIARS